MGPQATDTIWVPSLFMGREGGDGTQHLPCMSPRMSLILLDELAPSKEEEDVLVYLRASARRTGG